MLPVTVTGLAVPTDASAKLPVRLLRLTLSVLMMPDRLAPLVSKVAAALPSKVLLMALTPLTVSTALLMMSEPPVMSKPCWLE